MEEALFVQSLQSFVFILSVHDTAEGFGVPGLAEYLEELKKRRGFQVVVLREDGPLSEAKSRNKALDYALALPEPPSYLSVLEAGGAFELTALEKIINALESHAQWHIADFHTIEQGEDDAVRQGGLSRGASALLTENSVSDAAVVSVHALTESGCRYEEAEFAQGAEGRLLWLCLANAGFWGGTIPETLYWQPNTSVRRRLQRRRSPLLASPLAMYIKAHHGDSLPPAVTISPTGEPLQWAFSIPNALNRSDGGRAILVVVPKLSRRFLNRRYLAQLDVLAGADYRVIVVAIQQATHSEEAMLTEVLRRTHDVHILSNYLEPHDKPGYLTNLIKSRGVETVLFDPSRWLYTHLPGLVAHAPGVKFVDFLHDDDKADTPSLFLPFSITTQHLLARTLVSSPRLAAKLVSAGRARATIGIVGIGLAKSSEGKAALLGELDKARIDSGQLLKRQPLKTRGPPVEEVAQPRTLDPVQALSEPDLDEAELAALQRALSSDSKEGDEETPEGTRGHSELVRPVDIDAHDIDALA